MNEKNIILIAALGFGAFFLLTRKASAATVSPYTLGAGTGAAQTAAPSTKNTLLTGLLGIAGGLITQNRASTQNNPYSFATDFSAANEVYAYDYKTDFGNIWGTSEDYGLSNDNTGMGLSTSGGLGFRL
jgi:hypothetical protein